MNGTLHGKILYNKFALPEGQIKIYVKIIFKFLKF